MPTKLDIGIFIGALVFAVLAALAMNRYFAAGEQGLTEAQIALLQGVGAETAPTTDEIAAAKQALMQINDFLYLHNAVYAKVGEEQWEGSVKPEFLRELTVRTAFATGTLAPGWEEIVDWARKNPEESRALLTRYLEPVP